MSTVHRPLAIVFMGTPAFALPTLKALNETGHNIAAVYTQPPRPAHRGQKETLSPVHAYALAQGLPIYTPVSLKAQDVQAEFAAHRADVAIVAAYGLLLPKPILEAYPLGCINIHPSLLPRWRGAAPIQRTIMAGDAMTGICIMQMDEGLDTGDILWQEEEYVGNSETAGCLHDRLAQHAAPMVLQVLEALGDGSIIRRKQSSEGVTYAKKITREECRIDWTQPAETIYHQIRGLSPSPSAYFHYKGEAIKILSAEQYSMNADHYVTSTIQPGLVTDTQFVIVCGTGMLRPLEVQRPGKKRMSVDEMLKGYPIPPGSVLT